MHGGEHSLGGIVGHEVAETTDESPARVALVQRVTTACLRQAIVGDDSDGRAVVAELRDNPAAEGHIESK